MKLYLHLFAANTTRVELRALASYSAVDTISYINDATVEVTMIDDAGAELTGETWPVTLTYESGSNGNYAGLVSEGIGVSAGDLITAKLTATSGAEQGYWEIPVEVVTRSHRYGYG